MVTSRSVTVEANLDAARERLFVGRGPQLEQLSRLLDDGTQRVAHVEGPAGIGKTQLLYAFARWLEARGGRSVWVDGSTAAHEPSPLAAAVQEASSLSATAAEPVVLIVDNFEQLQRAQGALRDAVLPRLHPASRVVLASRQRLDDRWRTDPGWKAVLLELRLGPLSTGQCASYLERRGIPASEATGMILDSCGHPLTLALLADAREMFGRVIRLDDGAGPLDRVVSRFVEDAPSDAHVEALYAAAILLRTRPEMLQVLLERPNAHELYRWLARCCFAEQTGSGIVLHTLVSGFLLEQLRRRPEILRRLLVRALRHYAAAELDEGWIAEGIHVWSLSIGSGPGLGSGVGLRPVEAGDTPEILALARRHEGARSVEIMKRWREIGEWLVLDDDGLQGFLHLVDLRQIPSDLSAEDPGVRGLLETLAGRPWMTGVRPCWCIRFWMTRDGYQSLDDPRTWQILSHVAGMISKTSPAIMTQCLARSGWERVTRWSATPDFLHGADFELDGIRFGYLFKEIDAARPDEFFRAILRDTRQALDGRATAAGDARPSAPSRADVKAALCHMRHPHQLAQSRLVDSPAVRAWLAENPGLTPAEALREMLRAAAERALATAGNAHGWAVLERAYLGPAIKHEVAARELGLSYRTFRRYLESAIDRVTQELARSPAPHGH